MGIFSRIKSIATVAIDQTVEITTDTTGKQMLGKLRDAAVATAKASGVNSVGDGAGKVLDVFIAAENGVYYVAKKTARASLAAMQTLAEEKKPEANHVSIHGEAEPEETQFTPSQEESSKEAK